MKKEDNKLNKNTEKEDNKFSEEMGEDITQYGEFISSYFAWISLSKQKERVDHIEKMTKNKKNKDK